MMRIIPTWLLILTVPLGAMAEERTFRFRYDVQNTTNRTVKAANLLAYVPSETAFQRLAAIRVDQPHQLEKSADGNRWVRVTLPTLPPHGQVRITVTATVDVPATPDQRAPGAETLAPSPQIQSEAPEIRAEAQRLRAKTALGTAKRVYGWIRREVAVLGFTARDRGARWTLLNRRGDCSDMAQLFVAIARAAGVHARYVSGYRVARSALVGPDGYHSWAEVYVGQRWLIADPQARVFDAEERARLATNIGGARTEGPLEGSYRFKVTDPTLSARMVGVR